MHLQALAVTGAITLGVAPGPATFIQQLRGPALIVILGMFEVRTVKARGRTQRATGPGEFIEVHAFQRALDIGAAHKGFTHLQVIEGCAGDIQRAVGGVARTQGDQHGQVRIAPRRLMGLGRQRLDHVDLACLQRGKTHRWLLDELPHNALQPCRALMPGGGWRPVVIRVAYQFDLALAVPFDDLERAAAHRAFTVLVTGAQQCRRRFNAQKALGQHLQKRGIRCGQMHHCRVVIEHLGAAVLADITTGGTGLGFRIGHVVQVGLDRCRVERRAVGEVHVIAQMEGVHQAVGRHLPALGQPRTYLPLLVHRYQRVEILLADKHLRHVPADMGVQASGFAVSGVHQRAAADRLVTARDRGGIRAAADQQTAQCSKTDEGCAFEQRPGSSALRSQMG